MAVRRSWSRVRVLLPLALLVAAGCQDYNFNPVGHCLIQPGTKRVTLSNISTADVLFVVDDSGSMGGEQQLLANAFDTFISNLNQTNVDRRAAGLEPIDFHLAVTTTSIFISDQTTASCRSDCPGAAGQVCCNTSGSTPLSPMKVAKSCNVPGDCASGYCGTDCVGLLGEKICCDPTTKVAAATENVSCSNVGDACGAVQKHYRFGNCTSPGVATDGTLYPHGAFVSFGTNPRVLHFDKELYPVTPDPGAVNKQGFTSAQLEGWFKQNVIVGTCGSGEEQGLQAGRLALEKATAAPTQQRDTRSASGATVDSAADWPHANSKLVTVFVGDEDDCSSPEDPTRGVILSGNPGSDTCVSDTTKRFPVSEFVDYLTGLGRPLGAAFIESTQNDTCEDVGTVSNACTPGQCCTHYCTGSYQAACLQDSLCGGQAGGVRFLDAAAKLKSKGADVVVGSICGDFGTLLGKIADIVKPPAGLILPTLPAASDITVLRIADSNGTTRKTCRGPAPAGLTAAQAQAGYDWWFTATRDQVTDAQRTPTGPTTFVYINHLSGACEANPGETYSADYLGRLPTGGCFASGLTTAEEVCAKNLGGKSTDWTCFVGVDTAGKCLQPSAAAPGTCLCGGPATICQSGYVP